MKWKFFHLIFFLIFPLGFLYAEYFTIQNYNVSIILNKDSSGYVEETILVNFISPRHGIYRYIPYKYKNKNLRIKIIKILVSDDGENFFKEQNKVFKKNKNIIIKIGSIDKKVSGDIYYKIVYKVENIIYKDTFYWNIIGFGWNTTINNVNFSILFPEVSSTDLLNVKIFYGYGQSVKEIKDYFIDKNYLEFSNDISLEPHSGLTINIKFPPETFLGIPFYKKFFWIFWEHWGLFIPLLVFIIMFGIWFYIGRDESKGVIVIRYKPPKNITPAEAGALIDDKVDLKEVTATIFGLAEKGYLKISKKRVQDLSSFLNKERDSIKFEKLKEFGSDLKPFEMLVLDGIFCFGGKYSSIDLLEQRFYLTVRKFIDMLYEHISNKDNYFFINPDLIRRVFNYFAKVTMGISILFLLKAIIFGSFFSILFDLGLGLLISSIIIYFFAKIMPQKTIKGAKIYRELLGFKKFIETVDKDRLKRMALEDSHIFGKILPYAIALNVEKKWAEKFEDIDIAPANWYDNVGTTIEGFALSNIITDISRIHSLVSYNPVTTSKNSSNFINDF